MGYNGNKIIYYIITRTVDKKRQVNWVSDPDRVGRARISTETSGHKNMDAATLSAVKESAPSGPVPKDSRVRCRQ